MTDQEINVAIAKACGAKWFRSVNQSLITLLPERRRFKDFAECAEPAQGVCFDMCYIPNYCADLNAMHEAEKILTNNPDGGFKNFGLYLQSLDFVCCRDKGQQVDSTGWSGYIAFATARQRAEAFLRTLGLWKD